MSLIQFFKEKSRKFILLGFDLGCFALIDAAVLLAFKYTSFVPRTDVKSFLRNSLVTLVLTFTSRIAFNMYSNVWRYTSTYAYFSLVFSDFIGMLFTFFVSLVFGFSRDISYILIVSSVNLILTLFSRFSYRLIYKHRNYSGSLKKPLINVAIVGAGQIGVLLVNDLRCSYSGFNPVFFIDSDRTKSGSRISGLPVYHDGDNIEEYLKKYSVKEIYIAIANIDSDLASWLYNHYSNTGCRIKLYDIPTKDVVAKNKKRVIREFQIEDLLFRKPLELDEGIADGFYVGKKVLVTGGGGSIGSELCRQIASCKPKKLVIFDIYENNAYEIQQELIREYGVSLDLDVEIGSVRDRSRLESVFSYYQPEIVFHAAAHKHVPLMEHSGIEAIKNNVFGTNNVADMAEKYGVKKFILISTDKAVNPTNIMGASKRLCEMIIQSRSDSATSFAAVRFGNVLGSNGSVIPLFKRQIAEGGPITITDKRIIRYFMTIPEASQLVMQAGAMAKKGELFVLDMGKPVRIYDLAINMIKLSGLEPNIDIKIKEIGLRPGEKLYEELLIKTETLTKTENDMIFIEKDTGLPREKISEMLNSLSMAVDESTTCGSADFIRARIAECVPTFRDPNEINCMAESSEEMKKMAVIK